MWKGSVSFGLVSIPVKLYTATEAKNVSFRQVHEADGGRIQYKRVCALDGQEVPYPDIAKGYELDNGDMVVLTADDLAQIPLATSNTIDVLEFVPLESVDPIYYDRGYYLEPDKSAAAKPYVLLRGSLQKSGKVAIVLLSGWGSSVPALEVRQRGVAVSCYAPRTGFSQSLYGRCPRLRRPVIFGPTRRRLDDRRRAVV
jgi:DNA end-binding protein Ku